MKKHFSIEKLQRDERGKDFKMEIEKLYRRDKRA